MNSLFANIAYAEFTSNSKNFDEFILNVNKLIINPIIMLLFALAVVFFLYGVFEFISNQEDEEAKTKGKSHMIWGIIGITIMMGVFTIMNMVINTLNIEGINPEQGTVELPSAN